VQQVPWSFWTFRAEARWQPPATLPGPSTTDNRTAEQLNNASIQGSHQKGLSMVDEVLPLPPPTCLHPPSFLASSNSPSCKVYIESPVVRFSVAMLDGNGDICFPFRHESGMNCEEAGKGGGQGVESAGLACKMWVGRAHGVDFSPLLLQF